MCHISDRKRALAMFASHSLTIKSGQCVSETHSITVGTLLSKITFNTELTSMKNIKKTFHKRLPL